ncbi:methyltransferase domain-containing protein [Streptomyces sp. NPDC047841]|uniref:class I SAM-dependent methyltransferase n=1 Tax=Streptomyces sp. NPDC047841 TaxID=3154708 RepID=UPI003451EC6D
MTATLPRVLPSPEGKPVPPSRTAETFRAFASDLAAGRQPWTSEAARFITDMSDQLADDWDTTRATGRDEPVRDALTRGGPVPHGTCLELGSGTGLYTPTLRATFPHVVSTDLSTGMLQQAGSRSAWRVRADASALPLADASIAAVAAIGMLLFPAETARVLASGGVLLWINQLGGDGPLYLPADTVAAVLPGTWQATESEAGWGSWAVLRRTG